MKKALFILMLVALALLLIPNESMSQSKSESTEAVEVVPFYKVYVAAKQDTPLMKWIDRLIQMESEGNEDIVILDSNNKHSHGCLQYQKSTFDSYTKKYGVSGDIMDCDLQRYLAYKLLSTNPNAARHEWYTSVVVRGLGLPPKSSPQK